MATAVADARWSGQTRKEIEEFGTLKVSFRDTDDARSAFIVGCARSALQAMSKGDAKNYSDMCKRVVDDLQSEYGGAWHCIIGESFGTQPLDFVKKPTSTSFVYRMLHGPRIKFADVFFVRQGLLCRVQTRMRGQQSKALIDDAVSKYEILLLCFPTSMFQASRGWLYGYCRCGALRDPVWGTERVETIILFGEGRGSACRCQLSCRSCLAARVRVAPGAARPSDL